MTDDWLILFAALNSCHGIESVKGDIKEPAR